MHTKNRNRSRKPSQTGELVGVDVPRLVLWLLRMLPDWEWKRELCGGVWICYQTSLPMAPVWLQCPDGKSTPPRQSCELSRITTERRGKVCIALYPQNAEVSHRDRERQPAAEQPSEQP
jgi:hypothetical protein